MGRVTYLLDTNTWSELVRKRPDPGVIERFHRHAGSLATAAVVIDELEYGIARLPESERQKRLYQWLNRLVADHTVLPYDLECARWHGRERGRRSRLGIPAPYADGQIAATAVINGMILVTRNRADFNGFPDLVVESWFSDSRSLTVRPGSGN